MPERARLVGIEACVFDAYGTLFDVHSAVGRHAESLGSDAGAISGLWRQKQLEYSWLRSLMGDYRDFWAITDDALGVALAHYGRDQTDIKQRLMDAYLQLSAYPEVADTLQRLRDSGRKLAILSNGSPKMLNAAVSHAGLSKAFDASLSADELEIYKPDSRVYQLACDRLEVRADAICFVSSNGWDIHGSANFGFQAVWLNRFGLIDDALPGTPKAEIKRLDELLLLLDG